MTQQDEALRLAEWLRKWFGADTEQVAQTLERQHARIAELEAELEAVGAGGVQPLRRMKKVDEQKGVKKCQ